MEGSSPSLSGAYGSRLVTQTNPMQAGRNLDFLCRCEIVL